jgi:hypothetical protein
VECVTKVPARDHLSYNLLSSEAMTKATAGDFLTAKAAFVAAVKRRPGEPILLCDRAWIVMRSGESHDE